MADDAPVDAVMEDAYERPTDRVYSSRRIKEENSTMLSANRLRSPAAVKREEPYGYDDGDQEEVEVNEVRSPARHASSFWKSSYNRTYSMKERTSRAIFKQEHPADYQQQSWNRTEKMREARIGEERKRNR